MTTIAQTRKFEGNAEATEAWNGVLFDKFGRYREALMSGLAQCGTAVLDRYPVPPGARVLDVGCGFGDTTVEIARALGQGGEAVGVDVATRFVEAARVEAKEAGATNARFLVADVQGDDLGGPYDRVFSRFGTMFFASPVAALRNMRRSLAPGGHLTIVVWRKKTENAWAHEAEQAVLALVPLPEETDEATCGPGPFSMGSPDLVSDQMKAAGFDRIRFERFDFSMRIGSDMEGAIDFAMALGPAGEVMRLAGDAGRARAADVTRALTDVLSKYVTPVGVYAPGSAWIVGARAP
jgi:ubiquinone/menaquinone biosynthesis C-methylase UbiE